MESLPDSVACVTSVACVSYWSPFIQDLKLLGVLFAGQVLKTCSNAYYVDMMTAAPLRFPRCLWDGAEKFRTVGSWIVTLLFVFVIPSEFFNWLLETADPWMGFRLGYIPILFLGVIADDIFLRIHIVSIKFRQAADEKLGTTNNNDKPKKLPDDFPS